jgi:hypothetical protein
MTTQTEQKKSNLITRTLTFTDVTLGTDKKGNGFANFRADTMVKSGPKAGQTISIFGQAFGKSFAALKDGIVVGQSMKVRGFQDQRKADPENGINATRSFVLFDLHVPKAPAVAA